MAPVTPPNSNPFKMGSKKRKTLQAPNNPGQPITKAASRHRGKSTSFRRKKNIKVSRQLRGKILKVLDSKMIKGAWKQISYDNLKISNFTVNYQYVAGLAKMSANDFSNWCFDPEDFLHAASVLWRQKADDQGSRSWDSVGSFPVSKLGGTAGLNNSAPQTLSNYNVFMQNFKLVVKTSSETWKLKNNSQRTIVMKIYLLGPRDVGYKTSTVKDAPGNVGVNSSIGVEGAIGSPEDIWENALINQKEMNINLAGATAQTIYNSPQSCPEMNRLYKMDCTTVTLEPGQIYDYYIQGPQNLTINYANLFRQGENDEHATYVGIQKFMRYPLSVSYLDLVTDGTLSGHYPPSLAAGGPTAISFERIMSFRLEMPEQTAASLQTDGLAAQNQVITNNLRRAAYFFKVYTPISATGNLNRVDVQDPTMIIDQT